MEQYFAVMFEDVTHERSFLSLLSLTETDIVRQSNFPDYEIDITKNLALEKLPRQRILREQIALDLLEKHFYDK